MEMMNRRGMIAGLSGLIAASMLGGSAQAKERKLFFARIGRPIGLQLYTLGDEPAKDIDGTLAKVAAIGYRDVELPQLYGRSPVVLAAALKRAGLTPSAIHLAATPNVTAATLSLKSDTQRIVDDLGVLGIRQAVLPIMLFPDNFRPNAGETFQAAIARSLVEAGPDIWKRTAALLNEKAAALKPHGISLGYHNHNIEFAPVGGTTGWDILAKETDAKLVTFEVDVGWIMAAGLDPVAFLNRHRGRVRQLHVKDVQPTTKTNYALSMDPTQVGDGKLDWARVLPAAHKAGCRHFYVEQEPPFTMQRMDAAAKSYGFLSKLRA